MVEAMQVRKPMLIEFFCLHLFCFVSLGKFLRLHLLSFQDAFRQNLKFIKWMSPSSADAARAKLEHMADLIGYPAFVLNTTWLNQGIN